MSVALGFIVGTVVVGLAINLLSSEAAGWLPQLSERLVRRAADKLPDAQRERWVAEWLGDLAMYRDRPLGCLMQAAKISRSARAVAAELAPAPAVAGNDPNGRRRGARAGGANAAGLARGLRDRVHAAYRTLAQHVASAVKPAFQGTALRRYVEAVRQGFAVASHAVQALTAIQRNFRTTFAYVVQNLLAVGAGWLESARSAGASIPREAVRNLAVGCLAALAARQLASGEIGYGVLLVVAAGVLTGLVRQ